MNAVDPKLLASEEQASPPLFTDRRAAQCAWPLWGDQTPLKQKRCCGAAVPAGSRVPYCPDHMAKRSAAGTLSEQTAARALRSLSLKERVR